MNYFKLSIKVKIKKWFMCSARRISSRDVCMRVYTQTETPVWNKGLVEKMFLPPTTEAKTSSARESCGRWVSWDALKDASMLRQPLKVELLVYISHSVELSFKPKWNFANKNYCLELTLWITNYLFNDGHASY